MYVTNKLQYGTRAFLLGTVFVVSLGLLYGIYFRQSDAKRRAMDSQLTSLYLMNKRIDFVQRTIQTRQVMALNHVRADLFILHRDQTVALAELAFEAPGGKGISPSMGAALRPLIDSEITNNRAAIFSMYTAILRTALLEIELDVLRSGLIGNAELGELSDILSRQMPSILENIAKQRAADALEIEEFRMYALGAQLIITDGIRRTQQALLSKDIRLAEKDALLKDLKELSTYTDNAPFGNFGMDPLTTGFHLWRQLNTVLTDELILAIAQQRRLNTGVSISSLLVIVLLLYFSLSNAMSTRRSLRKLSSGTQAFINGDLAARIEIESRDEFSFVALNFNRIAEQMSRLLNELRQRTDEQKKELELTVTMRTKDLSRANSLLNRTLERLHATQDELIEKEKMASLGSLVAGISHEINTPLGLSYTMTTHLQDQLKAFCTLYRSGQADDASIEKFLLKSTESLNSAIKNLDRSVELISSFKSIAVDQTHDSKRSFNVKAYTEEILRSIGSLWKKDGHVCTLDIPESLQIYSYPGAYAQLLTNIIANAVIHAFKPGTPGAIQLKARTLQNDRILLHISDNGVGMPEQIRNRIFEPFFTTNRSKGGSGLGLSIAYNLVVHSMQGTISCSSEPNVGTRFTIDVPAHLSDTHTQDDASVFFVDTQPHSFILPEKPKATARTRKSSKTEDS